MKSDKISDLKRKWRKGDEVWVKMKIDEVAYAHWAKRTLAWVIKDIVVTDDGITGTSHMCVEMSEIAHLSDLVDLSDKRALIGALQDEYGAITEEVNMVIMFPTKEQP